MIADDIYTRLTTFAPLVAITGTRWSLSALKPGPVTAAAGAYQQISAPREYTLDSTAVVTSRWQFSAFAPTAREAKLAIAQVKAAFAASETTNTFSSLVDDERDMGYDIDLQAYRSDVDLQFIYPEV